MTLSFCSMMYQPDCACLRRFYNGRNGVYNVYVCVISTYISHTRALAHTHTHTPHCVYDIFRVCVLSELNCFCIVYCTVSVEVVEVSHTYMHTHTMHTETNKQTNTVFAVEFSNEYNHAQTNHECSKTFIQLYQPMVMCLWMIIIW